MHGGHKMTQGKYRDKHTSNYRDIYKDPYLNPELIIDSREIN